MFTYRCKFDWGLKAIPSIDITLYLYPVSVLNLNENICRAAATPKKTVKLAYSSTCASVGGLDSLPREDISGKITPTLLKGLESSDWKVKIVF